MKLFLNEILPWILPRLRIGEYHRNLPKSIVKKSNLVLELKESKVDQAKIVNRKSIFIEELKENLKRCTKYGGYKKFYKYYYWSHRKLQYFNFKEDTFGGLPFFIDNAQIISLDNITYLPQYWRSNLVNKYTFKIDNKIRSEKVIEKLFTFDIGMAETFQHFIQDCAPIIYMSKSILDSDKTIKITLPKQALDWNSRNFFFERMQIQNEIIDLEKNHAYYVKKLFVWNFKPYNAKFIFPKSWYSNFYNAINTTDKNLRIKRSIVILRRREVSRNFENFVQIFEFFQKLAIKLNYDLKVLIPGETDLIELEAELSNARFIISPVSGGNLNLVFAPNDCVLFELVPLNSSDSLIHFITGIGLTYIPIPINYNKSDSYFRVELNDLNLIKNMILKIIKT